MMCRPRPDEQLFALFDIPPDEQKVDEQKQAKDLYRKEQIDLDLLAQAWFLLCIVLLLVPRRLFARHDPISLVRKYNSPAYHQPVPWLKVDPLMPQVKGTNSSYKALLNNE